MTLEIFKFLSGKLTRNATGIITVSILMTEVIWQLYKKYFNHFEKKAVMSNSCIKLDKATKNEAKIFDVMFFSKDSALCRFKMEPCAKPDCAVKNLRKIVDYFDSAMNTVDICIYFFTCPLLANAIVNAHKRGVVIRLIMDETMTHHDSSQNLLFYKAGIEPKLKSFDVLVHHKFAIIDNSILITGSTNWTMTAFFGNFENILVTNESELVKPFVNEFNRLWTIFDTAVAPVVKTDTCD
ncbi:uncharacterized protein zuc [Linepithema humile]|uniref:uncharacterized protein zuc n=1 Tax=Linepithema humile TaxID=83485 RepID=UPI000623AA38|nr:PREDICTED: mitochondrial cardiolipin hydrolase [Linepithema humile]XP_012226657.1 PREDICTED: mitochondrial cardiolipin hydrolase [Linepithema humile]